VTSPWNFIYT